jgi:predicted transposase/invertase (TIGR01784 family)
VIFLAIANFTMFPEKKSYKSDHVILDRDNHQHDLKDFSFTFLELEKFTKEKDQLVSMIEKWAYYFKHAQETTPEDLEMVIGQDSVIKRAYEELDRFYWKEEELFAYEDALKKDMDYEASMDKKFDEGMKAALVKVAQNMLRQGLSIQNISSATGLSAKEVKKIQEETKKSSF